MDRASPANAAAERSERDGLRFGPAADRTARYRGQHLRADRGMGRHELDEDESRARAGLLRCEPHLRSDRTSHAAVRQRRDVDVERRRLDTARFESTDE